MQQEVEEYDLRNVEESKWNYKSNTRVEQCLGHNYSEIYKTLCKGLGKTYYYSKTHMEIYKDVNEDAGRKEWVVYYR